MRQVGVSNEPQHQLHERRPARLFVAFFFLFFADRLSMGSSKVQLQFSRIVAFAPSYLHSSCRIKLPDNALSVASTALGASVKSAFSRESRGNVKTEVDVER